MDVEQFVPLQIPGQPQAERGAEGELPQGGHRRTPAGKGQHRHPLVPLPAPGDKIRMQARAMVVGGGTGTIPPPVALGTAASTGTASTVISSLWSSAPFPPLGGKGGSKSC